MTSDCALSTCPNPAVMKVAFTSDRGTLSSLACGEHIARCIDRMLDSLQGDETLKLVPLDAEAWDAAQAVVEALSRHGGTLG